MSAILHLAMAAALLAQGDRTGDDAESKAAAQKGLGVLQQLVTEQNHASLGFEAPKDAASATLGDGLRVHLVRLDELKTWAAGGDAEKMLHALDKAVFPVMVAGKARAAVTVEKSGDPKMWKATAFGQPAMAKAVFAAARPAGAFLVQVPALNLAFVARRDSGKLMLAPTLDDARFDFKAGAALAAADVFAKLAPVAQKDDGLPK